MSIKAAQFFMTPLPLKVCQMSDVEPEPAISLGEKAIRKIARDAQLDLTIVQNAVRLRKATMSPEERLNAEQECIVLSRILRYATLALTSLPADPLERVQDIQEHLATLDSLAS